MPDIMSMIIMCMLAPHAKMLAPDAMHQARAFSANWRPYSTGCFSQHRWDPHGNAAWSEKAHGD